MLSIESLLPAAQTVVLKAGERLLQRGESPPWMQHLDSGRVTLGVVGAGEIEHRLGTVTGPFWLDASSALLGQASAVDAVAETEVHLRRVPLNAFMGLLVSLPATARQVLHDVAFAHRQQTELAVSRLAKDAESRCAEWLLENAHPVDQEALAVQLTQRKRHIASQLGIAPETLSRVLRHLRERGLISGSGRVLNLVDPIGLRSLAGV